MVSFFWKFVLLAIAFGALIVLLSAQMVFGSITLEGLEPALRSFTGSGATFWTALGVFAAFVLAIIVALAVTYVTFRQHLILGLLWLAALITGVVVFHGFVWWSLGLVFASPLVIIMLVAAVLVPILARRKRA